MFRYNPYHSTKKPESYALGHLKPGEMNKTEAAYADELEAQRLRGIVQWWAFEGIKFRLADATFYTPDFAVMLSTGELQAHEVKGHWEDDARVKIKVASSIFPVRFVAIKKTRQGWEREEF